MVLSSHPKRPSKPILRVVGSDDEDKAVDQDPSGEPTIEPLIKRVVLRVKEIRKAHRYSRRELSERSGVSVRYLVKLEGEDGNISIALLNKLAVALETPIEVFLSGQAPFVSEIMQVVALYNKADKETRLKAMQVLETEHKKAQRLCLVGLRGAGKSTLGKRISRAFDAPFIELNSAIEQNAGMPVDEIIALYGQSGYRRLEADTLAKLFAQHSRVVIAVAGGIVSEKDTFFRLLSQSHSIWVKAAPWEHMDSVRAQGDMRPMKGNPQALVQLREILKEREAQYSRADHALDTSGKSIDESASELMMLVRSLGIFDQEKS